MVKRLLRFGVRKATMLTIKLVGLRKLLFDVMACDSTTLF